MFKLGHIAGVTTYRTKHATKNFEKYDNAQIQKAGNMGKVG